MVIFDKAKWHADSEQFPKGLKRIHANVHIGMYLAWIIKNNLDSLIVKREAPKLYERLRQQEISPGKYIDKVWGGYVSDDMMTKSGADFSYYFYGDPYFRDLDKLCARLGVASPYHLPDTFETFDNVCEILDSSLAAWRSRGSPVPPEKRKPIWQDPIPNDQIPGALRFIEKSLNVRGIFRSTPLEIRVDENVVSYGFHIRALPDDYPKVYERLNKQSSNMIQHFRRWTERSIWFQLKRTTEKPDPIVDPNVLEFTDPYSSNSISYRHDFDSENIPVVSETELQHIAQNIKDFLSVHDLQPSHNDVRFEQAPKFIVVELFGFDREALLSINRIFSRYGIQLWEKIRVNTRKRCSIRFKHVEHQIKS